MLPTNHGRVWWSPQPPMKITFLLQSAFGMGGIIRSTLTLANQLARRHEVEILGFGSGRASGLGRGSRWKNLA